MGIEILFHPYTLIPKQALNAKTPVTPRRGALLCIDGGYSALHPWPELGDKGIDEQLSMLKAKVSTPLLERSLYYLEIDRKARNEGRSLFDGNLVPQSHTLIHDIRSIQGDGTYKIKIGRDPQEESLALNDLALSSDTKLRLDANCTLSKEQAVFFWRSLNEEIRNRIELFEDPTPYEENVWRELFEIHRIPLAYDHYGACDTKNYYSTRIIKPLIQNCSQIALLESAFNRNLVITSSLDHPFGQVIAAYEAAQMQKMYPHNVSVCGLLSHTSYETNLFSELLVSDNEHRLIPPSGRGFGFDAVLERIEWKRLV